MPDTNTTNLLLVEQTVGGNNNSWGTILNTNFAKLDAKLGDRTSIVTTGGDTALTETQERVSAILVSGTLVSNATITFNGRGGLWVVRNTTTGNYTVTCRISGEDGVVIPQGTRVLVYYNGVDIASAAASSAATEIPTGALLSYIAGTTPSGWVRANGRTIGNGASGSSERANADTEDLFVLVWDTFSNTLCPIFDSAGSATTRGANAADDYAANKRLTLPDLRGRTFAGVDDMGNSAASRLGTIITTQTTLGAVGGTETHTLTTAQMPSHTHTGPSHTHSFSATTGNESASHTHTVSGTTGAGGAHSHTVDDQYVQNSGQGTTGGGSISQNQATQTQTTSTASTHTHSFSATSSTASTTHTHSVSGTTGAGGTGATGSAGSGSAHSNLQPTYLGTWLLKL